ncbi:hypothetical protein ZWY2020_049504 [Hordeum vulgare]|nr:hypothetical protein ZWY2020_049504 [Hordeum vulgare]
MMVVHQVMSLINLTPPRKLRIKSKLKIKTKSKLKIRTKSKLKIKTKLKIKSNLTMPVKANVVADALSRNPTSDKGPVLKLRPKIAKEFAVLNPLLVPEGTVAQLEVQPTLDENIKKAQKEHPSIEGIKKKLQPPRAPHAAARASHAASRQPPAGPSLLASRHLLTAPELSRRQSSALWLQSQGPTSDPAPELPAAIAAVL